MSEHRYEIMDAGADVLIDGADISMRCNSTIRNALRQQLSEIAALKRPAGSYEPHNKETASPIDRVAWVLCQIIDDDAPMRWTRYRFAARCIASNRELMADLHQIADA